jgi:hypothetical protein
MTLMTSRVRRAARRIEKKALAKGPEWVITFRHDAIADPAKRTLYLHGLFAGRPLPGSKFYRPITRIASMAMPLGAVLGECAWRVAGKPGAGARRWGRGRVCTDRSPDALNCLLARFR